MNLKLVYQNRISENHITTIIRCFDVLDDVARAPTILIFFFFFFFFFFFQKKMRFKYSAAEFISRVRWLLFITKTSLYNVDPLKPHFYIVKLGLTGVNIIFLISAHNIDCRYSLEPHRLGGSNEYAQSMF